MADFDEKINELQQELAMQKEQVRKLDLELEKLNELSQKYKTVIQMKDKRIRQEQDVLEEMQAELLLKEKNIYLYDNKINNYVQKVEQLKASVSSLETEVEAYQKKESVQDQTLHNKEGHIQQLIEAEREYQRVIADQQEQISRLQESEHELELVKKTKSYRFTHWLRRGFDKMFPVYTKRRFFMKILYRCITHPILMAKMIRPSRIKNFFVALKAEGMEGVEHYYNNREQILRHELNPAEGLELEKPVKKAKSAAEYMKFEMPVYDDPQVSIVIPVYNEFDYTYNCLKSILKNSRNVRYEVIIANDCSTDVTTELDKIIANVKVVTTDHNLRFLLNCNNAAKHARGKYILFLNNDTQVQEDWLAPLVELIERDEKNGMVGSKLVYPDGKLQEAGGILWNDASAWNYGHSKDPEDPDFNYVKETDYISGAAIMIRRNLWEEIGGFDERFVPAYCEDSDLAFEVRRHGYKVLYQPKSVVVHFEGVSNGTDLNAGQKKYQVDNQIKFREKWKAVLEKEHFENAQNVFLARDKGGNKKHVLVIDHYVPTPDRDAGSKTTFMYRKMLVEKGYHITFLGDNFYREEPYTQALQQLGIFVLYGLEYAQHWKEWLTEHAQYFDVFYLNRPHITIKYIDFINELPHKGKVIYYGHDLHFLRTRREYELTNDEDKLKESGEWEKQELYIMRHADINYYPSVLEEEAIHEIDPSIPVKAITAYVFDHFNDISYDSKKREGLLFVGGFGHGPNIDAVLWFVEHIYPEVYARTHAPFYIVGAKAPKEITEIRQEGVVVKGFVSEEELQQLYLSCRVAVVPLRYGAGVKGKVVEALYYGIPIVTTSVGAEGIAGVEQIAVVKDEEEELIQAISAIYEDADTLKDMSRRDLQYVQEHFSTEAVWNIIKDDFQYEGE